MDKNIVALIREDVRTVEVRFFPDSYVSREETSAYSVFDPSEGPTAKMYKYVTTLDVRPGNLAVVYIGCKPQVVEIQTVHDTLEISPNEEKEYKWLVAVIDETYYQKLREQNKELKKVLTVQYQKNTRRQFREVFLMDIDGETQAALAAIVAPEEKK